MNVQRSIEEVKDGVKIDRIVERQGKPTAALSQEDPELLAEALKADGHQVTAEQIAMVQQELKAESQQAAPSSPPDEQNVQLNTRRTNHIRRNTHLEHVPSDEMDLLISTINEMDLGWKADVCKY